MQFVEVVLIASKAKIKVFLKVFSNEATPKGPETSEEKISKKTLILSFEVNVQPKVPTFVIISNYFRF